MDEDKNKDEDLKEDYEDTLENDPNEENAPEDDSEFEKKDSEAEDKVDEDSEGGESEEEDSEEDDSEEDILDSEDVKVETRFEEKTKDEQPKDDEDVDEDEIRISRIVSQETQDLRESNQKLQDQIDVDAYIRENPETSAYRNIMLKYVSNDSYKNLPIKNIAAIVSSKDLMKRGAEKERLASLKASKTKDPGSQIRRKSPGSINWKDASRKQYDAKLKDIRGY